jgi:DNA end-binding protein Ku
MPRAIWKGAISFGLVHVPVGLYPASSEIAIDFDWLDKRSMDPVGYKRVNKRTGREIDRDNIVKGIKVEGGDYVVLSEEEIKAAYPKTTQTIEIQSFVRAGEIPFTHLEAPYYLEPVAKAGKVYALLREAMLEAGVVGIARVVMHTKEHLCALIPAGPALMLNTLRWAEEIRPWTELELPAEGRKAARLKDDEIKMATRLIAEMTEDWKADRYADKFTHAVHALVAKRVEAGKTEAVQPLEEAVESTPSNVVDLTELLAKSLGPRRGSAASGAAGKAKAAPARQTARESKPSARKTSAGKSAARKRA